MSAGMPLKYPCTHYNIHLATLVIISLCPVMMSQSGDITLYVPFKFMCTIGVWPRDITVDMGLQSVIMNFCKICII
jgi:hypothetical protein